MAAGERDHQKRPTQRSGLRREMGFKGACMTTSEDRPYEDPHTVPAVGPRTSVRPLGEDCGGWRTWPAKEANEKVGTTAKEGLERRMHYDRRRPALRRSSHRTDGRPDCWCETFKRGWLRQVNEIPVHDVEVRMGHPTASLAPFRRSARVPT